MAAKLWRSTGLQAKTAGKNIDPKLYDQAKDLYFEAFYRINYIGAENSQGFHNPTEAARICGDSVALAEKCSGLLRQALATAGVAEPADINLELAKFLNNRGDKKLNFQPQQEFKDPFGNQPLLTPEATLGLGK